MTEVDSGFECPHCTRTWSTRAAADECCDDERWDRGRE